MNTPQGCSPLSPGHWKQARGPSNPRVPVLVKEQRDLPRDAPGTRPQRCPARTRGDPVAPGVPWTPARERGGHGPGDSGGGHAEPGRGDEGVGARVPALGAPASPTPRPRPRPRPRAGLLASRRPAPLGVLFFRVCLFQVAR